MKGRIAQCIIFSLTCWAASVAFVPGAAVAAEIKAAGGQDIAAEFIPESFRGLIDEDFVYQRENRTDPFAQFVSAEGTGKEGQKEAAELLPGMQRYEPGQLNLVAIILGQGPPFAMVQDFSGIGYIIHRGMLIGKTGVVEDIVANKVLIKQYSFTMAGEKRYHTVEMQLKKEGEE